MQIDWISFVRLENAIFCAGQNKTDLPWRLLYMLDYVYGNEQSSPSTDKKNNKTPHDRRT